MANKKIQKISNLPKVSSKGEPQSMAELLAGTTPVKSFAVGQKVQGTVVAKTSKSLILDIGGKSEGVLVDKAFVEARAFADKLKIGDVVTASVLISEAKDGTVILSLREAIHEAAWKKLEEAKKNSGEVAVVGRAATPAGISVEVEGISGFIPTSQLGREVNKNTQNLIGKYFKVKVIEVDRTKDKLVLSEKEVSEAEDIKLVKDALAKIKEGDIFDGVVTTVANFGCFVKIEVPSEGKKIPVEGLVHISELAWNKVASVEDVVSLGDKVKVKVISSKEGKLSFSMKQAGKDPWAEVESKYKVDTKIKGKVRRVSDFGSFIELEPGVEGLLHITKTPPGTSLTEGQEVNVVVEEIDTKTKKIALGLVLSAKPIGYK